ncbi:MAG: GNAT family N-acetyltransferase [Bacteroidetes Order II. Incertae sedis bacterium]|nr:GNAT family N-acetyltransferase [Bacteroidetes Order II. bacterium]
MIHIHPLSDRFVAEIQFHASNPNVAAMTYLPEPYPENGAQTFVDLFVPLLEQGVEFPYMILENDHFVGMTGITRIDFGTMTGEVGYWLGESFWGKGIASYALALATEMGFTVVGLEKIVGIVLSRHPASMRVLEKVRYICTGTIIEDAPKFKGETSVVYEMEKNRWQQVRPKHIRLLTFPKNGFSLEED